MTNSQDYKIVHKNNKCNNPADKKEIEIKAFERQAVDYCIDGHQINGDYKDFKNFSYNQLRTLLSLEQIDEYPCYLMHYYGEYNFEDYLKAGSENFLELLDFLKKKKLYPPKIIEKTSDTSHCSACSSFSASTLEGHSIFGRNYDMTHKGALLVYTNPPCAYASISMVDINYLGYYGDILPSTLWQKRHLLSAPYMPCDGMNECGVAISQLELPQSTPTKFQGKVTLLINTAVRLVLDYAKNIDEAIKLLKEFNITFPEDPVRGPMYVHLLISDTVGNSAIIEFLDGEMKIIRNNEPWQVVTNFIIYGYEPEKEVCGGGLDRYEIASEILRSKNGIVTLDEAMDILNRVKMPTFNGFVNNLNNGWHVSTTQWSIVYDSENGELNLVLNRKYGKVIKLNLLDKFFSKP
ncbi:linear amide C-N hydrolase [Clostridium aestuarii]|uniref:Linear amide C-N hydrolase n=1 Tax=Clostridium aestuarii TaxID=338193 RepID=A0ABT4CVM3_9CLOT|nr:linear amide C-N hydrolase [Clostridium aestuarii]MCY6483028.1 linear amide C-N hydrolase [Clostridium aestuarii]